jgi:two-component system, chemotaxis family, protein-glutamate methylesterase/glutaminase
VTRREVAGARVRVVVIDDSVVIRRVLTTLLSNEPGVEVVGSASNGKLGLEKVRLTKPDVVILDIEMPVMDGLATLPYLRAEFPATPVIMFSTQTTHGAAATLDALALGAADYVTKPSSVADRDAAVAAIRSQIVPKIDVLAHREAPGGRRATPPRSVATRRGRATARVDVVAIAVSTGGPKALHELVPRLPRDLPVPIVIVQHMPEVFTRLLADRLDRDAPVHVTEAVDGERLMPGTIYIAPGGRHMLIDGAGLGDAHARLDDGAPVNSCRPSADPLFRSVATVFGAGALGVVLTGMGSDGCEGARALVDAGAEVITQDQATSVVWGMPGAVVRAGLSASELPLEDVAGAILARVSRRRGRFAPAQCAGAAGARS